MGVGGGTDDAHDQSHTVPMIMKDTPLVHGAQQLQLQTSARQVNRSKQYKYKTEKPFVDSMLLLISLMSSIHLIQSNCKRS